MFSSVSNSVDGDARQARLGVQRCLRSTRNGKANLLCLLRFTSTSVGKTSSTHQLTRPLIGERVVGWFLSVAVPATTEPRQTGTDSRTLLNWRAGGQKRKCVKNSRRSQSPDISVGTSIPGVRKDKT